ncbi:MAG: hypothetical protein IPL47_16315 [Phyllobacteriaceae bacterium]|nr:hypothetical protein [Phyllobacteriaceae bacterium]
MPEDYTVDDDHPFENGLGRRIADAGRTLEPAPVKAAQHGVAGSISLKVI